ncbi:MAG: chitobiase/beta-hexosaminidase C-terminal domain-containing protein, partial [Acidobacteria bacterium]|nr:chitobiase/beta-hexosaminidase C-terminal domain-containing protein [Acidobacteriota bacterium]
MRKFLLTLAACACVCLASADASATANFVYHEQTANFVATPTCPSGGTDTACGRYVENTDRSGAAGFQLYSPETYSLHFKVEFQFFTNQARVYYTTDGTDPSGSFGTPSGTTQVAAASFTCTYSDQTQGCQIVDVLTGAIPPQPAGTTVKYIIGAWHSGGGPEVFANSGTCTGCFSCTDSTTGCA